MTNLTNLPAVYMRHADAVMSARLQNLETAVVLGFQSSRDGMVTAMTALASIRDTQAWQEEMFSNGTPIHTTFESYLTSFVERLREIGRLELSVSKVAEHLRIHKRFVKSLGMDAEGVLTASPQAMRGLEAMTRFDSDGNVKSLADGLNADAIPGGMTDDPQETVRNIAEAVVNAPTSYEAVGLVKAISNKPEITFLHEAGYRKVTVRVRSYLDGNPYVEEYPWGCRWPDDAQAEYFKRLRVRD